jgi:para-aminobenzoate synthetase
MKPILIDHDDSFTHILAQYIGEIAKELPLVLNHKDTSLKEIQAYGPSHIIMSPGPGTVLRKEDFAIGNEILSEYETQIPILGVCLGHQGIAAYYGGEIIHAPEVMHGKRSEITHNETDLFAEIPSPFTAMRYHSLAVTNLPGTLEIIAQTDNTVMAIRHKELPIFGVQFHPESIGTEHGKKLLKNFLSI